MDSRELKRLITDWYDGIANLYLTPQYSKLNRAINDIVALKANLDIKGNDIYNAQLIRYINKRNKIRREIVLQEYHDDCLQDIVNKSIIGTTQRQWKYFNVTQTVSDADKEIFSHYPNKQLVAIDWWEYMVRCAFMLHRPLYEWCLGDKQKNYQAHIEQTYQIASKMLNGTLYDAPLLCQEGQIQQGRHRNIASHILGENIIPVWIIGK